VTGYKRMAWTVFLVAAWYLISTLAARGFDVFSMNADDWKLVAVAVLAGVGALITNWLVPFVKQYGIGSK